MLLGGIVCWWPQRRKPRISPASPTTVGARVVEDGRVGLYGRPPSPSPSAPSDSSPAQPSPTSPSMVAENPVGADLSRTPPIYRPSVGIIEDPLENDGEATT